MASNEPAARKSSAPGDAQVNSMMLEDLAIQITDVDGHWTRPECQQQSAHPGLEFHAFATRDR